MEDLEEQSLVGWGVYFWRLRYLYPALEMHVNKFSHTSYIVCCIMALR